MGKGNSHITNAIAPHRPLTRMVTIPRHEGAPVVVTDTKKKPERPVRASKLFQKNWMRNIGRASEGREDESADVSNT